HPRYGGRGISFCERWTGPDGFERFVSDMGERPSLAHSLDRIDPNGPYSPENCRWATKVEQQRNTTASRLLTHAGDTRCLAEWAEVKSIPLKVLWRRRDRGWSLKRALSTPHEGKASAPTVVQPPTPKPFVCKTPNCGRTDSWAQGMCPKCYARYYR